MLDLTLQHVWFALCFERLLKYTLCVETWPGSLGVGYSNAHQCESNPFVKLYLG